MGDRCGMSISADSPSDETLNRGLLALLLWRQYEFPFGINIVQFSIFFDRYCFRVEDVETPYHESKWTIVYRSGSENIFSKRGLEVSLALIKHKNTEINLT